MSSQPMGVQLNSLKAVAKKVPGLHAVYRGARAALNVARSVSSPFLRMVPAGHFYSPIPDMREVLRRGDVLFRRNVSDCPGVDVRAEEQLELVDRLTQFYGELPFPETPNGSTRYYFGNQFFRHGDAIVLYAMIRYFRPRRVIEVGSGFSSAVMLDTNERFLDKATRFTFIEPYPERLLSLITRDDKENCEILESPVQDVDLAVFETLGPGDILFIDSSHVVKAGSDVPHLLFNVLPGLRAGVIVHFHDVFWPFEYPKEWLMAGTAWNEAYFIRAFLEYNDKFEVLLFNSFIAERHREVLRDKMPLALTDPGASLWLRKKS